MNPTQSDAWDTHAAGEAVRARFSRNAGKPPVPLSVTATAGPTVEAYTGSFAQISTTEAGGASPTALMHATTSGEVAPLLYSQSLPIAVSVTLTVRSSPYTSSFARTPIIIVEDRLSTAVVYSVIERFYLSATQRHRKIAERLTILYRDALEEEEVIKQSSLSNFAEFFFSNPHISLPKITLTPDGTLRTRWIQPRSFIALEFLGSRTVRAVCELPRGDEKGSFFWTEPMSTVVGSAHSLGATFG
jgi:hypothetical protein